MFASPSVAVSTTLREHVAAGASFNNPSHRLSAETRAVETEPKDRPGRAQCLWLSDGADETTRRGMTQIEAHRSAGIGNVKLIASIRQIDWSYRLRCSKWM